MGILRDKQNNNNKKHRKNTKSHRTDGMGQTLTSWYSTHLLTQRLPCYGKLMEEGKIDISSPANLQKISMQQGTM